MSEFAMLREMQHHAAMRNERLVQFALTEDQGRALAVEFAEGLCTPEEAYAQLIAGRVVVFGLPVVIAMTKNI